MSTDSPFASQGDKVLDNLMRHRTVTLTGEIDYKQSVDVMKRMLALQLAGNDTINLIIDSAGGSVDSALRICDLMATVLTAPVRGIALGFCGSSATYVMLHCTERLSSPNSQFLLHSGSVDKISVPIGLNTTQHLQHLKSEAETKWETKIGLYMRRLTPAAWNEGTTEEEKRSFIHDLIGRGDQRFDNWIFANEAVRIGLIQRVITDKLGIFPS
jgi:ATP-dependent protease ClpP protease subunit